MKTKALIIPIICAGMSLLSCQKESGNGRLGFEIESGDVEIVQLVKSSVSEYTAMPAQGDFSLDVRNEDGSSYWNGLQKEWDNQTAVPMGNYTVTANYGDSSQEGFGKPYLTGKTSFAVDSGKMSNVSVGVKLGNCIVRINCTEAFRNYFPDYTFTIRTGADNSFSFPKTETRAVFMDAFKFTVSGSMTNQGGTKQSFAAKEYANLEAGTCYTLTFDAGSTGGSSIKISFDDRVDVVDLGFIELN